MENKSNLTKQIDERVDAILKFLDSINLEQLHQSDNGKWSISENIVHLNKSVAPINMALNLPKFSFIPFGKAKKSEGKEAIIAQYHAALKNGGKATKAYVPNASTLKLSLSELKKSFQTHYNQLNKRLSKWSEKDLDKYRLPHPLIGKITVRDMISFTIYHLEHHYNSMKAMN